jgi:hypothetical protein
VKQKVLLIFGCVVCEVACGRSFLAFEGAEFGGGTLAGKKDLGGILFVLAVVLAFKFPRSAAISALMACFVSLPFYLYLVFPRPFRKAWPGNWSILELPRQTFVWDGWWMTAIVFNVLLACFCALFLIRRLTAGARATTR